MPLSLSKNGGLTLLVTHENHSMSFVLFVPVSFYLKKKKSKIKLVYQDSNPGPSQV